MCFLPGELGWITMGSARDPGLCTKPVSVGYKEKHTYLLKIIVLYKIYSDDVIVPIKFALKKKNNFVKKNHTCK